MRRRNKYNAKPVMVDGVKFASKREARRYGELKLLEQSGHIRNLELQPKFPITVNGRPVKIRSGRYTNGRAVSYHGDFAYFRDQVRVIEDSKGMDTPVSRLKRALVEAIYNVEIRLV